MLGVEWCYYYDKKVYFGRKYQLLKLGNKKLIEIKYYEATHIKVPKNFQCLIFVT